MRTYVFLPVLYFLLKENESFKVEDIISDKLNRTLTFMDEKFDRFGFDGTFGLTLAQVQLNKILLRIHHHSTVSSVGPVIENLVKKCEIIREKMMSLMPIDPPYMITFSKKLLNVTRWTEVLKDYFEEGSITDLGIYSDWTANMILRRKQAIYKGVKSDRCLREILDNSTFDRPCFVSEVCSDMMLDWDRIDTGYLLTHRLLYLQIKRLQGCTIPGDFLSTEIYIKKFCSYMLKEARTNQILGYPYHDIFLEQVALCGMEGFEEFLNERWLSEILNWQNAHGCFASVAKRRTKQSKRSSTTIDYGCSDHSTGLGAAVLALFLRFSTVTKPEIEIEHQ